MLLHIKIYRIYVNLSSKVKYLILVRINNKIYICAPKNKLLKLKHIFLAISKLKTF